MSETRNIYDNLIKFESRGQQGSPYPVHKKLIRPFGNRDLLDWLITVVSFSKDDYVLDAGCGTGYALFYLYNKFHIKGLGISISSIEVDYASTYTQKKDLEKYLKFKLDSYKTHRSELYSKILCIESLKHTDNIEQTINNLLYNLSPGGIMVIIDDFIIQDSRHVEKQKRFWNSPAFNHIENYTDIINKNTSYHFRTMDLTEFVPARPVWKLNLLLFLFTMYNWISLGISVRNVKTYKGGLFLEKLYARNKICYKAIIVKHKIV